MSDTIIAAILSSITTIFFFFAGFFIYIRHQREYQKLINLSAIVQVERSLDNVPTAFDKFHGITKNKLDEAKITKKELAYLVASFTAGRIYDVGVYRMDNKPFAKGHYRYKMLAQPSTRNAWPLILKMMTTEESNEQEDRYIKKLQATIDFIELQNANS